MSNKLQMAPGRGIFISGTDTGVGKTVVAAAIARYLHNVGIRVGVMKPVTSGAVDVDGTRISEDAELLRWAAGCTAPDHLIAPYLLKEPLAPSEAAAREGVIIACGTILQAFVNLAASHEIVIVEGAGGLLVPLADDLLVVDLAQQLGLPMIVVARPNLGTVNHTLMTCECARNRGIPVAGIVINGQPAVSGPAEEYAPRLIEHFSGLPVMGVLPFISNAPEKSIVEELANMLGKQPSLHVLAKEISRGYA